MGQGSFPRNEVEKVLTHISDKPVICKSCGRDNLDDFEMFMTVNADPSEKRNVTHIRNNYRGTPLVPGRNIIMIRIKCPCGDFSTKSKLLTPEEFTKILAGDS